MPNEKDVAEELAAAAGQVIPDDDSPTEKKANKSDDSEEKEPEEKLPEEPDDHKERSQLGRRVKAMEDNLTTFMEEIREIIQDKSVHQPAPEPEEEFDEDWIPTTRKELDEYSDARDRKKEKERQRYESEYRARLNAFSKTEEAFEEILNEVMTNYNLKHSNDGVADATVNFLSAKAAFYESKAKKRKSPLDKNEGKKGENLGGEIESQNMDTKGDQIIKLDPEALDFMKRTGMSEESAQKALKEDLPPHLQGIGRITPLK